jgi:hypothetical protein
VEENPDIAAFRDKVSGLRDMELFAEPRVRELLVKILEATR